MYYKTEKIKKNIVKAHYKDRSGEVAETALTIEVQYKEEKEDCRKHHRNI